MGKASHGYIWTSVYIYDYCNVDIKSKDKEKRVCIYRSTVNQLIEFIISSISYLRQNKGFLLSYDIFFSDDIKSDSSEHLSKMITILYQVSHKDMMTEN